MAISPIESTPNVARAQDRDAARKAKSDSESRRNDSAVGASDPSAVAEAVASNRAIKLDDRSIEFSYDEEINRVIVKVKSRDTDEVVRQIPPDEYLKFLSRFKETVGVLFDEVA